MKPGMLQYNPACDFASLGEALDFAERVPCEPGCESSHVVVWCESGRVHCEFTDDLQPPTLPTQLRRLYSRTPHKPAPAYWPAPPEYNQPLVPTPLRGEL
jgi:hypothetical protein